MAEVAPKRTYIAALGLPSGQAFHTYESTSIEAASESDAIAKAIEWSKHPEREEHPGTCLVVTIDGRSIHSERLGWTNAPRPSNITMPP